MAEDSKDSDTNDDVHEENVDCDVSDDFVYKTDEIETLKTVEVDDSDPYLEPTIVTKSVALPTCVDIRFDETSPDDTNCIDFNNVNEIQTSIEIPDNDNGMIFQEFDDNYTETMQDDDNEPDVCSDSFETTFDEGHIQSDPYSVTFEKKTKIVHKRKIKKKFSNTLRKRLKKRRIRRLNRMLVMEETDESHETLKTVACDSATAECKENTKEIKDIVSSASEDNTTCEVKNESSTENETDTNKTTKNASESKQVVEKQISSDDGTVEIGKESLPDDPTVIEDDAKKETEKSVIVEDVIKENSINNSELISENVKRCIDEPEEHPVKKLKVSNSSVQHEKNSNEYQESTTAATLHEIQIQENRLLAEIEELDEEAREKEREWNNIIHMKKMKEEILLRLQRKRQVVLISNSDSSQSNDIDWELALDMHIKSLNSIPSNKIVPDSGYLSNLNLAALNLSNSGVTVVPVSSANSSKQNLKLLEGSYMKHMRNKRSLLDKNQIGTTINRQRSILPKPSNSASNFIVTGSNDYNGLQKTGPKGQPMMDVNLIVEKFRQNHPEEIPRRGRRVRAAPKTESEVVSSSSRLTSVLNLNSSDMAVNSNIQNTPSRVDPNSELGIMLASSSESVRQRNSHFSSNDSSHSPRANQDVQITASNNAVSFKDVLVQFARMSQSERRDLQNPTTSNNFVLQRGGVTSMNVKPPPPPPCPEVTLHPVLGSGGSIVSSNSSTPPSNSLLHGILTKNQPKQESKPFTALSPTLARLLTGTTSQPSDVSDINDLLANAQNQAASLPSPRRGNQSHSPSQSTTPNQTIISPTYRTQFATPASIVNLDDLEAEDSADRLVIDESNEINTNTTKTVDENASDTSAETSGQVPQCQGCKENPAQFVCAGCTSRWYCSRECQVSDWDDHCEMCSG